MEFPDAGRQCCHLQCKQLDFLPVPCAGCDLVFCSLHFQSAQHVCTGADRSGEEKPATVAAALHECSQDHCGAASSMHVACNRCNRYFCLAHRHHGCHETDREGEREKWEAPQRQFQAAKEEADRQVEQGLQRAQRSASKRRTAAKVRLMRLKGRALGPASVPATQRAHFLVHLPVSTHGSPASHAVFVSRTWTLGRAVDSVAATCGVANRNNEARARKLRLFRREDGQSLGDSMDTALEQLLEREVVVNGDSLILEYVPETGGAVQCLDQVEQYSSKMDLP